MSLNASTQTEQLNVMCTGEGVELLKPVHVSLSNVLLTFKSDASDVVRA